MITHQQFIDRLVKAAESGADLLPFSLAEEEHILSCSSCAQAATQILTDALGEEFALAALLIHRRERGALVMPPTMPQFDLNFLNPAAVWQTSSPLPHSQTRSSQLRMLAEGTRLRFQLYRAQGKVLLDNLSTGLYTVLTSPAPAAAFRSNAEATQQTLAVALPDVERGLQIVLRISLDRNGYFSLGVELRSAPEEQPAPEAEIVLRSKHGVETATTRDGQRSFFHLNPDDYTIEIQMTQHDHERVVWNIPFTLERKRNARQNVK